MRSYLLIAGFLWLAGTSARAQDMGQSLPSPIQPSAQALEKQEIACRTKAKEAAAQSFRSCMVETKSTQIEQIRKEYQEKLSKMKAEYEQQLGKVSGKKSGTVQKTDSRDSSLPVIEIKTETDQNQKIWTGDFSQSRRTQPAGKAILYSDKSEAPEPIPVESIGSNHLGE